jgi:hypothetical protein
LTLLFVLLRVRAVESRHALQTGGSWAQHERLAVLLERAFHRDVLSVEEADEALHLGREQITFELSLPAHLVSNDLLIRIVDGIAAVTQQVRFARSRFSASAAD